MRSATISRRRYAVENRERARPTVCSVIHPSIANLLNVLCAGGAAYTLANQLLGACPLRHGFEGTY